MRKRKQVIRNVVAGDPIDFYIDLKEKDSKRRIVVSERMLRGFAVTRLILRTEEERSVLS